MNYRQADIGSITRRGHPLFRRISGRCGLRQTPEATFEIEPRIEAMAEDGLDMQVLIPNNSPFYYDVDANMGANVSRAYDQAIARVL